MCNKVYTSAPLPFQGQKRRFISDFKEVLTQFDDIDTVVDLFGGSGLLSHIAKRTRPELRVIYNDYDYYCDRLGMVDITNEILSRIRPLMKSLAPDKRIPEDIRHKVVNILNSYPPPLDYITLSSSLLFSGKWAKTHDELISQSMYSKVKQTDYEVSGYLDGLEIVHMDYRDLFKLHKDNKRTLFLLDPPYLSTDCGSYENYWKLSDYLEVLKLLVGTRYIYFTSNKSQLIELCEWIKENASIGNPFEGVEIRKQQNKLNYQSTFTDIMLVKE